MAKARRPSAKEVFARNVRLARRAREISQEQLANVAGMSRAYLSEVEKAARNISIDRMEALADALGYTVRELVDEGLFAELTAKSKKE